MQVLGDLIKLPPSSNWLPLPWWHRAPLGLQNGTWCYVASVKSKVRPVGDLVISVLKPSARHRMLRIKCTHQDEVGVVSKAINVVQDFNIALAESVTMDAGHIHEINLFIEPIRDTAPAPVPKVLKKALRKAGFNSILVQQYPQEEVAWQDKGLVQNGWIKNVKWQNLLTNDYGANPGFQDIDLTKAVVSADTSSRLLRFVFPYKNARSIRIEHSDEPGALKQILDILFRYDINLLSKLLRRGGAKPKNAVLIAVCEPRKPSISKDVYREIAAELRGLSAHLEINEPHFDESGVDCNGAVSPKQPNTIVAHTPPVLFEKIKRVKASVGNQFPVFLSRRFVDDKKAETIAETVRKALVDNGCAVLEASPGDEVLNPSLLFIDISAKMRVAKAAIVLVVGIKEQDAAGKNLPHEFGFMQGQTKPILLLVEKGGGEVEKLWSNIDGVFAPRFPSDQVAFAEKDPNSIKGLITTWMGTIRGGESSLIPINEKQRYNIK